MQNTLAMAPLAPKLKREKLDGHSVIVARCGVRDCPEKLCYLPNHSGIAWQVRLADGYDFKPRENCWIKSKRAMNRSRAHRAFTLEVTEVMENASGIGELREQMQDAEAEALRAVGHDLAEDEMLEVMAAAGESYYLKIKQIQETAKAECRDLKNSKNPVFPNEPGINGTGEILVKCALWKIE